VLKTKSILVEPDEGDGLRICVMRSLQGLNRVRRKYNIHYDMHFKSLAPSKELMQQYVKEKSISWQDYVNRYHAEVLKLQFDLIHLISHIALEKDITLLCSEREPKYCHRKLLAEECKIYRPDLEVIVK